MNQCGNRSQRNQSTPMEPATSLASTANLLENNETELREVIAERR